METVFVLYRILIGISATALFIGLILIGKRISQLNESNRHLFILAIANFISMIVFIFNIDAGYKTKWSEAIVFIDSLILILNMSIGYFVYFSLINKVKSFANQIQKLFLVSFISVCIYSVIYYVMNSSYGPLNKANDSFYWIFGITLILYLFGSLIPALFSIKDLLNSNVVEKKIRFLLILNGLNNTVGLIFFTLEFPSTKIAVILNILMNLIFSYYIAYYFLYKFFDSKQSIHRETSNTKSFSWIELQKHLNYWDETKMYLQPNFPDLVEEIENTDLTSNEKIHYALKKLNIKAKDIAIAMNISVKAVEMNRYRIKRKV